MLSPDQTDFYNRWLTKANAIVPIEIGEFIDKYVTLFINYNALYNIVPRKIALRDGTLAQAHGDKIGATRSVRDFLTSATILAVIPQQLIDNLSDAMVHFNIKLDKNGDGQPVIDASLRAKLKSTKEDEKCLALLEVLYYVRCNIVHGNKALHQYQVMLLEPVIEILGRINLALFDCLRRFPF